MGRPIGSKNSISKKVKVVCNTCHKLFEVYPYRIKNTKKFYCGRMCAKTSHIKMCANCKNPFVVHKYRTNAKFCSKKCYTKQFTNFWLGGKSKLRSKLYSLCGYKKWRKEVLERDDYTCCSCGLRGGLLQVDHIIPLSFLISKLNLCSIDEMVKCKKLWDITNGQTLCVGCHRKKTIKDKKYGIIRYTKILNKKIYE